MSQRASLKKALAGALLLACAAPALFGAFRRAAAYDAEKKLPTRLLRQDLRLMGAALREAHGALDRYIPKAEWEERAAAALARIDRPMSEREFYVLLAPLVAAIGCGHTTIHPSYAWQEAMRRGMPLFPFKLAFVEGRAHVQRNYSQLEGLELGVEVVSINGRPLADVIERMLALIPADAGSRSAKTSRLEGTLVFGTCHNLLFGKCDRYETVLRPRGGGPAVTVLADGVRAAELDAVFRRRYPADAAAEPPIKLEHNASNLPPVSVLTIRTFDVAAYRRAGVSYPAFLSSAFQELRAQGARTLLIDLRSNEGGDDAYGRILLSYLMDRPFRYFRSVEVKPPPYSFWEHTNRPAAVLDLPRRLYREYPGGYELLDHPNLGWQQPQASHFAGRVYVLLDGSTLSAAGECASVLHARGRARFIGSECGAGYAGNTSGLGLVLTLPYSQVRVGIPLCKVALEVGEGDGRASLAPDVPFQPSLDDVLSEADAALVFALKVIAWESRER